MTTRASLYIQTAQLRPFFSQKNEVLGLLELVSHLFLTSQGSNCPWRSQAECLPTNCRIVAKYPSKAHPCSFSKCPTAEYPQWPAADYPSNAQPQSIPARPNGTRGVTGILAVPSRRISLRCPAAEPNRKTQRHSIPAAPKRTISQQGSIAEYPRAAWVALQQMFSVQLFACVFDCAVVARVALRCFTSGVRGFP